MDNILEETESKMNKVIDTLEERFKNVRAGRANPSMLDPVKVDYYGVLTPLAGLASISALEARKLQIKPFDKNCLPDIEKAIYEANLGFTPNNTGDLIFITIPELTEERRKEFVKQVKKMAEEAKIQLRNIRQDANNHIKNNDEISEDEEKNFMEDVQELINKYNKEVDNKLKSKEDELMTV